MGSASTHDLQTGRRASETLSRRRAAGTLGLGVAAALVGGLGVRTNGAKAAGGGNAPEIHWGIFVERASPEDCLFYASAALYADGLAVHNDWYDDDYTVIGSNESVAVLVACVPLHNGDTWIIVHAASDNSTTAELARNRIRTEIQDSIRTS